MADSSWKRAEIGCERSPHLHACWCVATDKLRAMKTDPLANSETASADSDDRNKSKKPTPDLLSRAAERFQLVGLGHWATAAEGWCQRFAGLEHRAGEDEIAPACCLLRVALRYSRERARPSDVKVAEDLAVLPFTRWCPLAGVGDT